jgi:MFS family permease
VSRARGQVRQGVRYAWEDRVLRQTLLAAAVVATLAFNYPTTLPLLTTETFGGDAGTFGALLAVASIGSLLGSLVVASRPGATQRFMAGASVAFGLAMGAVASAPALAWAFALAVPMGAGGSAFASTTSAVLQERSRPEMRGRLMALYAVVFLGSTPIGGPIVGWVGEHVNPRASLYLGALAAVSVGLVLMVSAARRDMPTVPSQRDMPTVPSQRDMPTVPSGQDIFPRAEQGASLPSWGAPQEVVTCSIPSCSQDSKRRSKPHPTTGPSTST